MALTPNGYFNLIEGPLNLIIDPLQAFQTEVDALVNVLTGGTGSLVTSVFGRVGAVTAQTGDYSFSQISGSLPFSQIASVSTQTLLGRNSGGSGAVEVLTPTTAKTILSLSNVTNDAQVKRTEMGVALGVATLDASTKIPLSQLPDTVVGAVEYQGTWNASANSPNLGASSASKGDYYVISVAGATSLGGITDWKVGDWAIYNGTIWEKVDNTDAVLSVFGRFGAVVAATNDYTWAQIDKSVSSFSDIATRSASDISSGTLSDARLSANVPLKDATNIFTAVQKVAVPTHAASAGFEEALQVSTFVTSGTAKHIRAGNFFSFVDGSTSLSVPTGATYGPSMFNRISGIEVSAWADDAAVVPWVIGVLAQASNHNSTGNTVGKLAAVWAETDVPRLTDVAYGVLITASNGEMATDAYGLRIDGVANAVSGHNWGVYSAGAWPNYFGGSVYSPTIKTLEVISADSQTLLQIGGNLNTKTLKLGGYGADGMFAGLSSVANAATGFFLLSTNPAPGDTITVNGVVFTFVSGASTATDIHIDTTNLLTVQSALSVLNGSTNPLVTPVTYGGTSNRILMTHDTPGAAGNAFTISDASTHIVSSGTTLTGGTDLIDGITIIGDWNNKNHSTVVKVDDVSRLVTVTSTGFLLNNSTANLYIKDTSTGLQSSTTLIITPQANNSIRSTSYTSGLVGWNINAVGNAEFENVLIRGELRASVFKVNEISATAGTFGVFYSASTLFNDVTTPASTGTSFTFDAKNSDVTGSAMLFNSGDVVRIKAYIGGGGTVIGDAWATITARTNNTTYTTYTATLNSGSLGTTFRAGTAVVDYGPSGTGFITLSTDGTVGASPNLTMATHAGSPWTTFTTLLRLGNLNGGYGYATDIYGFATGQYGVANTSWITLDQSSGLRIGSNTTTLAQWFATASGSYLSGDILIGQDNAGKSNTYISAGALSIRLATIKLFSVDTSGNVKIGTNVNAASTTNLFISNSSQTYNSEAGFVAGDILVGDNTYASNFGNIKITGGSIKVRRGVTDYVTIDSTEVQLVNILKMKGANSAIAIGSTPPTSASVGTGIWIDRTGLFGLSSNTVNFKIDTTNGQITATAGLLGGWSITSTDIRNSGATVILRGAGNLAFGSTPPTSSSSGTGIFIDSTGFYGLNSGTQRIKLDQSGLVAGGVTITGLLDGTGAIVVAAGTGTTSYDGLLLRTAATATIGSPQHYSPQIVFRGKGFGTGGVENLAEISERVKVESNGFGLQDFYWELIGSWGVLIRAHGVSSGTGTVDIPGSLTIGTPLLSNYGGTGNGFTKFTGPATSEKVFTLPNSSATILTSAAVVTVAQGGTSLAALTANNLLVGNGTSAPSFIAPGSSGNVLTSNGSSWASSAPPTVADSGWQSPTFVNSWANLGGGWQTAGYRKIGNVVYLRGVIQSGAAGTVAFNLASGYRPAGTSIYGTRSQGAQSEIYVAGGGDVTIANFAGAWCSLEGINFTIN